VPGTPVPAAVARLTPIGNLPGSQRLNLAIGLPLRNAAELDVLLQQLYDPASRNYHRYLMMEEFTERFGPTEADYQALIDFVQTNGLAVTRTYPNRLILSVAGAVADIQRTFNVTLRVYPHPTEARNFYAPDVRPTVATTIPILDVSGLDDYFLPRPNSVRRPAGVPGSATPKVGSGPSGSYRGYDFRTAYVPGTSLTGTGQNIGLLQFDGFYSNDIATYVSQAGLPTVPITVVPVDGGVSNPGSGSSEVSLDIEMVISMAPGISRVYVFEAPNPSPWVDLLNAMVAYTNILQFSCSWGGGGVNASAENIFKQMGAQGQSFFNATGDSDAFTSTITFPSDSTNITEVGGTTLTTGSGATYSSETVWNWGLVQGQYIGSSGGVSTYYGIPYYQLGIDMVANQGSTTMRNVPDVALTADNIYVVYGNGSSGIFGGTSCAAPLWAGFTALANEHAAARGKPPVGFLNPALYSIGKGANYGAGFHDTTTGNNFSSSSPTKYAAAPGYDLCTGWGTPNGTNLINLLVPPPAPLLVSNSFVLMAEGCVNGAVDPAETVTVSLGLVNVGQLNTVNLVATLLATNGILFPSGPQSYGAVLTNGAAVARSFTFTSSGTCGGTNTCVLQLQDGADSLGTVAFSVRLGQLNVANVFSQAFDGVTAPALPAGWTTAESGFQSLWVTSTTLRDTVPNSAFSSEASKAGVNELDSPTITLPSDPTKLTFRHNYNMESGYDGGVLEIKIGGGSWTDIEAAGGSFVSGGYVGVLGSSSGNPLGGRPAWTGSSGGFITTVVNLPPAAAGQTIQLRWRCGTDRGTSGSGWYVDTVSVTSSTYTCCSGSADLGVALAASPNPVLAGQNLTYTLTVTNLGPSTASSVTLTDTLPAGVTFVSASPGCSYEAGQVLATVGTLSSGSASDFTVTVTSGTSGLITNTLTAASPTADPNSANNTATVVTTVNAPPTITLQPGSQAVLLGTNATFLVTAAGTAPLAYQWRLNGTDLPGAVKSALTLTNVQVAQAGTYTVRVTNDFGSVLSSNATLDVLVPPGITTQPSNQTVMVGSNTSFTVFASGTAPLAYQWKFNGTDLPGAVNSALALTNAQLAQAGTYAVLVSNDFGSVLSSNAILTVLAPPAILTQPSNQTVVVGSNASFTVTASGTLPLVYQWAFNGTSLAGATDSLLTLTNVQLPEAGSYSVMVTNDFGSELSSNATLSVLVPPAITTQPSNQTVSAGSDANFSVLASGTAPLAYQWAFNGTNLPGAVSSALTLTNVQSAQGGSYSVSVTNDAGSVLSSNAVLIVLEPPLVVSFGLQGDGSFLLNGSGAAGQIYVLLVASNLTPPVVWSPLQTNQADPQGLFQFTDPGAATQSQRFYRFTQ